MGIVRAAKNGNHRRGDAEMRRQKKETRVIFCALVPPRLRASASGVRGASGEHDGCGGREQRRRGVGIVRAAKGGNHRRGDAEMRRQKKETRVIFCALVPPRLRVSASGVRGASREHDGCGGREQRRRGVGIVRAAKGGNHRRGDAEMRRQKKETRVIFCALVPPRLRASASGVRGASREHDGCGGREQRRRGVGIVRAAKGGNHRRGDAEMRRQKKETRVIFCALVPPRLRASASGVRGASREHDGCGGREQRRRGVGIVRAAKGGNHRRGDAEMRRQKKETRVIFCALVPPRLRVSASGLRGAMRGTLITPPPGGS